MKIATWNINGITSRLAQVLEWCAHNRPDVLCLQETKCIDAKFPHTRFHNAGFEFMAFTGERSYNGVALLSRHPISDIETRLDGDLADESRRFVAATIDSIRVVNVYVPHGTKLASDKFAFKLDWITRLRRYFDNNFSTDENVLLCGDLNVAPHELDVWKPSFWKDKMHFTRPERDAIQDLKKWGFVDVFRQLNDDVREYSWWSNFHHDFEKDRGLRIDHIWASPPLADLCRDCWIDKEPRASDKPSDHAPVVAVFDI